MNNPTSKIRALGSKTLIAATAATMLLTTGGADAQLARRTFSDAIEVKNLNLEVVVTDRDGQRTPELAMADFTLYVDDQPVPIEYFTEVRNGDYAHTVERYSSQGVVAGEPSGTSFLVFIDEFFALDEDKKKVLTALKQRVENREWRSIDRVAIVAWNGRGIEVITDWTADRNAILGAIDAAIGRPGLGHDRQAERNEHDIALDLSELEKSAAGGDRFRLDSNERAYAELFANQLEGTVGAAAATMRSLDQIPGRKAMVLLSGGWPMNVDDWVGRSPSRSIEESTIPSGADLYEPLAETANLLSYSIYGVDVPGRLRSGSSGQSGASGAVAGFLENELHGTLKFLSAETGGLPLIDGDRISALREIGRDVDSFYWLGFSPTWNRDDARHGIRVEVDRPDVAVRARTGYLDAAPRTQVAMAVESSLLFGAGRPSADLQLAVGNVEPAGDGLFYVDIEIEIPIAILTIQESDGNYDAEASLFVSALDASGGRVTIPPTPLLLSSPVPFPAKGAVAHTLTLTLRENTERVAMALYDVYGGKTYTNTITKDEADGGAND